MQPHKVKSEIFKLDFIPHLNSITLWNVLSEIDAATVTEMLFDHETQDTCCYSLFK